MPGKDGTDSCRRTHAEGYYYLAANGHVVALMYFKQPDWPESRGSKCTGPEENSCIGGIVPVEEQEKER